MPTELEKRVKELENWKIRAEKGDWKDSPFTERLLNQFEDWGEKVEIMWSERQVNEKVEIKSDKEEEKSGKIELSGWQLRIAKVAALGGIVAIFRNLIEGLVKVFFNG